MSCVNIYKEILHFAKKKTIKKKKQPKTYNNKDCKKVTGNKIKLKY